MSSHEEAKKRAQVFSAEYGSSADFFGHKDYHAAKEKGASDEDILGYLDQNSSLLRGKNTKGKGGLYDQISRGDFKNQYQAQQQAEPERTVQTIGSTGNQTNAVDNTVTADNDAVPSNRQITQTQNVSQDNDIDTRVTGNNNTVITEQDNSIRQYGGDNRSFTYNASGAGPSYMDTPVSAATMSGFYDVDDSPAAQASFMDRWTTMNRDNQKRYAGDAMKNYNMFGKIDARSYTPQSMATAIGRHTQYSFDRADRQTGHVFGDIWNPNYITEKWQMPDPPKEIESNAADIAKKAKEDIEDI